MGVGDLCLQVGNIVDCSIDVRIQAIVFIFIGNDFLLQNGFLMFELTRVPVQVVNFSLYLVVVEVALFHVGAEELVILADSGCGLFEPESLVEELFVVGEEGA